MTRFQLLIVPALLAFAACGSSSSSGSADAAANPTDATSETVDAPPSSSMPPVYFNHTYGVVSQATIDAIQTNEFVQSFIDVEVRTTVRPDLTYTGTYLNLQNTYLEFFPTGTFDYTNQVFGIALGDEAEGGLDRVVGAWQGEFGAEAAYAEDISHDVDGVDTPWFRLGGVTWSDESPYTSFWIMEYYPDEGSTTPRSRSQERARRYAPAKPARDVLAGLYAVRAEDLAPLRSSMESAGLTVADDGDGYVVRTAGSGDMQVSYFVQPLVEGQPGLRGLVLRTAAGLEAQTITLGDGSLVVGGEASPSAILWFTTPTADDLTRARSVL